MRIRRKTKQCLNCGHTLGEIYNYCPNCGQENNDNNISFWSLISDFLSNYFALDSKLGKSTIPFFLKPGYLTNRFTEGKRASYVNPVRLYLVLSLFFFFIFSNVGQDLYFNEELSDEEAPKKEKKSFTSFSPKEISDLNDELSDEEIANLDSLIEMGRFKGLEGIFDSTQIKAINASVKKASLREKLGITDSLLDDSTEIDVVDLIPKDSLTPESGVLDIMMEMDWDKVKELDKEANYSDSRILDSVVNIQIEQGTFKRRILEQSVRVSRTKNEYLIGYILKNLPIMMFFLLPIFALFLKLLYVRRYQLYIKHLIHSLHLHSYAYLIYGTALLISYYGFSGEGGGWINTIAFIIVTTYSYISFLKVYRQGKLKTLIKFWVLGFFYFTTLSFSIVLEVLISSYFY